MTSPLATFAPAAFPAPTGSASPILVVVCNHKGGVAKTTTCVNLATGLATAGQTVVVADFDSLASATRALGAGAARVGTYEVMTGRCPIETALVPTPQAEVWVLAATPNLHLAEVEPEVIALDAERLRARLGATQRCDTILIDCPPSLGVIAVNVIAAADLVLVPVQPTTFARDGLERTLEIIAACRAGRGGAAPRILITMADLNDAGVRRIIDQIRQDHGDQVYPTPIPLDSGNQALIGSGRILIAEAADTPAATAYLRATLALMRDQRRCRPPAAPVLAAPRAAAPVLMPPPPTAQPPAPSTTAPAAQAAPIAPPPDPTAPSADRPIAPAASHPPRLSGAAAVAAGIAGFAALALWLAASSNATRIGRLLDRALPAHTSSDTARDSPADESLHLNLPIPQQPSPPSGGGEPGAGGEETRPQATNEPRSAEPPAPAPAAVAAEAGRPDSQENRAP